MVLSKATKQKQLQNGFQLKSNLKSSLIVEMTIELFFCIVLRKKFRTLHDKINVRLRGGEQVGTSMYERYNGSI